MQFEFSAGRVPITKACRNRSPPPGGVLTYETIPVVLVEAFTLLANAAIGRRL